MDDTILNLMISHHALIDALFVGFKDEAKDKSPRTEAALAEFSWELKKHFFAEENAIFDYFPLKTFEVFEVISHLKDEHLMMLIDLKRISDSLPEINERDIENFANLLEHHRQVEEKELYPKLDKDLREEQKKQIIHRIKEIPVIKQK